jgi:hypothetical protein
MNAIAARIKTARENGKGVKVYALKDPDKLGPPPDRRNRGDWTIGGSSRRVERVLGRSWGSLQEGAFVSVPRMAIVRFECRAAYWEKS